MFKGGICFITDRSVSSLSVEDQVKIALDGGVQFIQYREKEHSRRETFFIAEELRKVIDGYDCTYIVNDHADIALAVGAEGVHLGQDDHGRYSEIPKVLHHLQVQLEGRVPAIHQMDHTPNTLFLGQIPLYKTFPAIPHGTGGLCISETREVHQKEPFVHPIEVEHLCLARLGRDVGDLFSGASEENIDEG